MSVILPCYNEEKYIKGCIESIISNDYDKNKMEILIIDGMSSDRSRDIVKEYTDIYSYIKLIDNPKRYQTYALNLGITIAKGDTIIRIDCHATYSKHYIEKIVQWMQKEEIDNVGGVCVARASADSNIARAIALAISHPFGVGNSYFRVGLKGPKYVDTVPFGAFRKSIFEKIGLFEETFIASEDDEFNYRIIRNGGKILLDPEIYSYYYARDNLKALWKQFFKYGYYKVLVLSKYKSISSYRQVIPSLFIIFIVVGSVVSFIKPLLFKFYTIPIALYIFLCLFFSLKMITTFDSRTLKTLLLLPLVFMTLHFSYGIGFLAGIFKLCYSHGKRLVYAPATK